jgi:hypothetical protein
MKSRAPNLTLILPGFLELATDPATGVQRVVTKQEPGSEEAGRIMNVSADTAKRMAEEGAIFARRKSNRPHSPWVFCKACCESWRQRNQPCADHLSAASRAISREPVVDNA